MALSLTWSPVDLMISFFSTNADHRSISLTASLIQQSEEMTVACACRLFLIPVPLALLPYGNIPSKEHLLSLL